MSAKYDQDVAIAFKAFEENMVNNNPEEGVKAFGSFDEAKVGRDDKGRPYCKTGN